MPRIRSRPDDFIVTEIPLYPCKGEGEHTFLFVEKRLATTEDVARRLAERVGVARRDVGFAGRKDRAAVTRQWFSVPRLAPEGALDLELPQARVLCAERHPHKLRTAHLRGNHFEIVVRDVGEQSGAIALDRMLRFAASGFPNRYGRQRFGRHGDNAERGAAILRRGERPRDRRAARFLLSALQSAVFNEVLRRRPLPLDELQVGDVAVVHASGGLFLVDEPESERDRLETFEISGTGPIFGERMKRPEGKTASLERQVLESFGVPDLDDLKSPRGLRLDGGRRALRARPEDATCVWGDGRLELQFTLPAGTYATVLVEELFDGEVEDAAGGGDRAVL